MFMPRRAKFVPPSLERSAAARERARKKVLDATPRWYNPWCHLLSTTGIGVAVLTVGVLNIHHLRPVELLVLPVTFLLANAFEWRVHKYVLHRPLWPVKIIYKKHTPEHHAIYQTEDMAIRSTREFRLVLIPAAGVLGSIVAALPFAMAFAYLSTRNVGWLFLIMAGLYQVSYELFHLSYHLAPESFIGRRKLIRWLRNHHATHHDPRLMHKWNFNVTFPLFDWVRGTIYKASPEVSGVSDDHDEERAAAPAADARPVLPASRPPGGVS
jgi:hypothetical protein